MVTALKITGYILLALAALVLLLLLILCIPVKYSIDGNANGKDIKAGVKIKWFFRFVNAALSFDMKEGLLVSARVSGKEIFSLKKEMPPAGKTEGEEAAFADAAVSAEDTSLPLSCPYDDTADMVPVNENPAEAEDSASSDSSSEAVCETENAEKPHLSFKERILSLKEKIKEKAVSLKDAAFEKAKALYEKLLSVKASLSEKGEKGKVYKEKLLSLWRDPDMKPSLNFIFGKLKKILKHILPRKGRGEFTVGTGDAFGTARIFEVLSVLYPLYGKVIEITPSFNEKVIKGEISAKGRISIIYLAFTALRIYLNRGVRRLYERTKVILDEIRQQ